MNEWEKLDILNIGYSRTFEVPPLSYADGLEFPPSDAITERQVTGASGQTGSTGYYAAKELVARGYRVRALVRTIDHRLSRLEALGDVEIFKGDLLDYESVRQAVKGVKRIYFVYPVSDGLLKATTYMAKAAREEGVKGLVNMSQATSLDQGVRFSNASQAHWCSEEIFNWANIGAIHINPYYFMENYIIFPGPTLQRESTVYVPYDPKMKHYPVAAEDLGLVIAKLMVSPEAYNGQRIPLLGPNRGSWKEHYEVASKILGKQINYVHVPVEAWAKASEAFIPDFTIKHLSGMARRYNEGGMDWDHSVSRLDEFILRAQQTTVEQFFENNKELFGKQGLKLIYGVDE